MKKIINMQINKKILISTLFLILIVFFLYYVASFISNSNNLKNNLSVENLVPKENQENKKENKMQNVKTEIKIIAIGDSLTAGYNLPLNESYPKILEKKLQEKISREGKKEGKKEIKIEVINAGVSGETTAGLLERVDFIKTQNPEIVLITIGGNDAFRNLPIKDTKENIEKIIISLKEKVVGDKLFLMQIKAPLNLGVNYSKEFNNMYKEISQKQKVNLLEFVTPEVFLNKNLMLEDGIHPNKNGYEIIVDKYILENILKK